MDEKKAPDVPYIVHEGDMARQERTIHRLWILCLVVFATLLATNAGWIWYEAQWEDVTVTETEQDGNGVNIYGRDIIYGAEGKGDPDEG